MLRTKQKWGAEIKKSLVARGVLKAWQPRGRQNWPWGRGCGCDRLSGKEPAFCGVCVFSAYDLIPEEVLGIWTEGMLQSDD